MSAPLDVAGATETIRAGSKSFAAAARLFDRRSREGAVLLYAWCRYCDDVVDGQNLGHRTGGRPGGDAAGCVDELERLTRTALDGDGPVPPAFAGLREVVRRHAIPHRHPLAHLEGFRMDAAGRRYGTLADTLDYCYGVAGVVGVMMAHVMGARDPAVLDRACDLGLAFQLTNIARDLVDDAENGRVYLPDSWLAEAGIPREALASPEHRERLAGLAARLVATAEPYYGSARIGIRSLPARSAWAIATALGVYRQIGREVVRLGPRAWDRRVSTSRAAKLAHVGRAGIGVLSPRTGSPEGGTPRSHGLYTRPA